MTARAASLLHLDQSSTLRASLCYGVPHLSKHRKGPPAMAAIVVADLKMIALSSGYGSG